MILSSKSIPINQRKPAGHAHPPKSNNWEVAKQNPFISANYLPKVTLFIAK